MKPQTNIRIDRVQGDTVPIVLRCQIETEEGIQNVVNSATVKFNLDTVPVISVTAASAGNGLFTVPVTEFTDLPAGQYSIEVEVDDGTIKTIGKGRLNLLREIA